MENKTASDSKDEQNHLNCGNNNRRYLQPIHSCLLLGPKYLMLKKHVNRYLIS